MVKSILLFLIHAYRTSKTLLPVSVSCRHWPSCSSYAEEALRTHGAARGTWLALKRLTRCRPGSTSGYDPVPEKP